MSATEHSIVLSIKKIELPDGTTLDDGVTCYLYLNSSPFSVCKVSDSNNSSALVSAKSLDDSLQLVFRGKEQNDSIGSVSFRMNYFAQANTNRFTRWITLFDDPVCDSFAGNIGEDKSRPRAFIDFEVLKEESYPARSESSSQVSFELYLKEKEQNGLVLPQIKEELEVSDMKDSIDDQNYISVGGISVEAHHETKVHPISNFTQLKGESEGNHVKHITISEENYSPLRVKQQSQEGFVEALSSQDLNRNQNYRQKESKETSGKSSNREENESLFYLEQQNTMLNSRITELNQKVQDLEVKNMSLKESEEASESKLHHLKIQVEKLRFKTENYETLVSETEQELSDAKDQLTAEIAAKTQLLSEKEGLSASLQQLKEAYEELKRATKEEKVEKKENSQDYIAQQQAEMAQATEQIKQSFEQLIEQREKIQNDEKETLKVQVNQLREEVQRLKSIIQDDSEVIQNLQKEVSALRQREEETAALGLGEKLKEAEDKIKFYEEKTKSMIEVCTAYLFKGVNQFESIEDLIIRVQKEINNNKQEMQELKTVNEALELKLSICDNKLLADTLWGQINDFKQQVSSLEKERESQKNELFKVNENYSKLINKYTELTEVLANLQQPVQKVSTQKPVTQKSTPTMGNLSKTIYNKLSTRTVETPDEIESKLAEFTASNKISPAFLSKVDKGQYLYNGRKITLKVISGRLMVKGVAGYKPLQDFIKAENGTRTPPRTTKEYPKTERKSFDANSKRDRLELTHTQIADHMRRDLTPDSVRSMSFSTKEHLKDFTPKDFDTRPLLTEPSQSETKIRPLLPEQVRVKDLIASRSVERKISYNIAKSGQKRESLF